MRDDLMKEWNIECVPVRIQDFIWDLNDKYILKEYHNLSELQRSITMLKKLSQAGVLVQKLIELPDGREYLECDEKYYVLTTKLEGKSIAHAEECGEEWFFEFGKVLADLHKAFLKCEKSMDIWKNSLLDEMNGWVKSNLLEYRPDYLKMEQVFNTIHELSQLYDELPNQLIHRDVHLGNFLFDKGNFSGYIDFDLSQSNIRIFDLCYFLLGLLLKQENKRIDAETWYRMIYQTIKGYNSVMELKDSEKRAVTCVMKSIELIYAAYFLKAGDKRTAREAIDLFYFVKENEDRIRDIVISS